MTIEEEAWEYYECICALELAMLIAKKYKEPMGDAIRRSAAALSKRIQSKRIRQIMKGLRRSVYPVGALTTMRRNFDECCESNNAHPSEAVR